MRSRHFKALYSFKPKPEDGFKLKYVAVFTSIVYRINLCYIKIILLLIIKKYTTWMSRLIIITHRLNGQFFGTSRNEQHTMAIDIRFTVLCKSTMS